MPTIRVLFADLPSVLREMFTQQLGQENNIQIVGHSQGNVNIMLRAQADIDVIILGTSRLNPPPGICSHLLNEFPHMLILVYSLEQNALAGYWLGIRKCRVQAVNSKTLVESIQKLSNRTVTL